jgi:hypothetical protein
MAYQGKEFVPTEEQRRAVSIMASYGAPEEDMAAVVDVSIPTLRKHFRRELQRGAAIANAKVAGCLFQKATADDLTPASFSAAIWWTWSRMGWKEPTQKHEHIVTVEDAREKLLQRLAGRTAEESAEVGANGGDPNAH